MRKYLPAETAPRDGTIIWGLFERCNKRKISMAAAYDVEYVNGAEAPPNAAQKWVHDEWQRNRDRIRSDPTWFFRPLSDSDAALECGRMVGWRPAAPYSSIRKSE